MSKLGNKVNFTTSRNVLNYTVSCDSFLDFVEDLFDIVVRALTGEELLVDGLLLLELLLTWRCAPAGLWGGPAGI